MPAAASALPIIVIDPTEVKCLAKPKKYMWMWGDKNFVATFNPVRWSEYKTAASMLGDFEQMDSSQQSRPVKIKDKGSGSWGFGTVPEAIEFLKGEVTREG
mmetsp:Transcript_90952/g.171496  ORF Transcript_90952/g.171496 Transcript_90952/m.171496 type:complete len:101 (+) Transcript_90952:131-433(+)